MNSLETTGTPLVEAAGIIAGYLPGVNILNGANLYANQGELIGIMRERVPGVGPDRDLSPELEAAYELLLPKP
ncbi:MAG: hypothetical protein RIS19_593 [Actinomycetota bacterium]